MRETESHRDRKGKERLGRRMGCEGKLCRETETEKEKRREIEINGIDRG